MAKTYDATGTLRSDRRPGDIDIAPPKFWIVGPKNQNVAFITGDVRKIGRWVNKFVYFRGCVEREQAGRPPVVRTTYLGDDPPTRDATPPCR